MTSHQVHVLHDFGQLVDSEHDTVLSCAFSTLLARHLVSQSAVCATYTTNGALGSVGRLPLHGSMSAVIYLSTIS